MTRANRDEGRLHPKLLLAWTVLKVVMQLLGRPVFMTEGVRSNKRQSELYAQGRTAPGAIVTHARPGQSAHNPTKPGDASTALDFAFRGQDPYSEDHPWELVGAAAKLLGLRWGGDWTGKKRDRPHLYIVV